VPLIPWSNQPAMRPRWDASVETVDAACLGVPSAAAISASSGNGACASSRPRSSANLRSAASLPRPMLQYAENELAPVCGR